MKCALEFLITWWKWRRMLRRDPRLIIDRAIRHVLRSAPPHAVTRALDVLCYASDLVRNGPLAELIAKANRNEEKRRAKDPRRETTGLLGASADGGPVRRDDQAMGSEPAADGGDPGSLPVQRASTPALPPAERDRGHAPSSCSRSRKVHDAHERVMRARWTVR